MDQKRRNERRAALEEPGIMYDSQNEAAVAPARSVPAGDGELATHLFERYHAEIFAYLARMVGDREWAQDLTQETFLSAHRASGQLAAVENPRAWLYRVATNAALNGLKRKRRFRWLPWQEREDRAGHDALPASGNVAEEVGRQALIEAALSALPPEYRAPLLLYAHHGLKVAEIAETLGLSEGAARMRLQRGREMFRREYRKEDGR
jgi:RNA polymerase sigma-70 factor (ECF subfamily)